MLSEELAGIRAMGNPEQLCETKPRGLRVDIRNADDFDAPFALQEFEQGTADGSCSDDHDSNLGGTAHDMPMTG